VAIGPQGSATVERKAAGEHAFNPGFWLALRSGRAWCPAERGWNAS